MSRLRSPRVVSILSATSLCGVLSATLLGSSLARAQTAPPGDAPTPPTTDPPAAEPAPETTPATADTEAAAEQSVTTGGEEKSHAEELKPIPQNMQIQVPVVPPAVERTVRVHRGFYLGVNAGIGHNSGSYDDNHISGESLSAGGFNLGMDLLLGYAASPGLAVGGALIGDFLTSADFQRDGFTESNSSAVSLLVGPFVDGFPNPSGPLHLGGTLGLAHVRANKVAFDGSDLNTTGLGFAAWLGYVPWVSDHFSIGLSLQLMGNFTGIGADRAASTRSLNLMVNALHF